MMNETDSFGW